MKNITLEMSLKPFFSNQQEDIKKVCTTLFEQWYALTKHADEISVLLWVADGSEILDYTGDMAKEMEWAKYIGGANPRMEWDQSVDPERRGLHARYYLYRDDPAVFTYRDLKNIVSVIKETGFQMTGKHIRVGETFDPGPEFAKSDFKYNRHNEICIGESMGRTSMVCCYGVLKGDDYPYAAYPNGIPDGTPFGTFLGKQAQIFLTAMEFDYLWLSNGFGFGTEAWGTKGAIFNGKHFESDKIAETEERIMQFWSLFRKECCFPIETRGTNLSVGIDYATDAVNIDKIYSLNPDLLPPPNSPWAALDGDYGLELMGYLTRMAELPADDYLFRFYVHDPWWMNSPWLDRYEKQPPDIYLPLACTRINKNGMVSPPSHINFLTVDNSLGEMPECCPNEVTPYILDALSKVPDRPSPFVLVYPFKEYQQQKVRLGKPFFEDWFMVGAINGGLPLNTVISTDNFNALSEKNPDFLKSHILVTPIPEANSRFNQALIRFVQNGGQVMLYGNTAGANQELLEIAGLVNEKTISGTGKITSMLKESFIDDIDELSYGLEITDGGLCTIAAEKAVSLVDIELKQGIRTLLTVSSLKSGGKIVWCRGCDCARLADHQKGYPLQRAFVLAAAEFGYKFSFQKHFSDSRDPVLSMHANSGSCYISGYVPDTTVELRLKTPFGAPLLTGSETMLIDGASVYYMPRAFHSECRVFINGQPDKQKLTCKEMAPVSYLQRHRLKLTGLKNATVFVLPNHKLGQKTELLLNSPNPYLIGESFEQQIVETVFGPAICAKNITGTLIISDCAMG